MCHFRRKFWRQVLMHRRWLFVQYRNWLWEQSYQDVWGLDLELRKRSSGGRECPGRMSCPEPPETGPRQHPLANKAQIYSILYYTILYYTMIIIIIRPWAWPSQSPGWAFPCRPAKATRDLNLWIPCSTRLQHHFFRAVQGCRVHSGTQGCWNPNIGMKAVCPE